MMVPDILLELGLLVDMEGVGDLVVMEEMVGEEGEDMEVMEEIAVLAVVLVLVPVEEED